MSVHAALMPQITDNTDAAAVLPLGVRSDNELVAAVTSGDEDAFRELFERHRQAVARRAYRFFARREQVEEIVQDTFTKVYFALSSYRGTHERSFIAWLSQIAVRVCYDELRRPHHQAEQMLGDLTDDETDFLQHYAGATGNERTHEDALANRDLAAKLLARLTPDDRLVLTLLHGEEHSSAEIAALTGWSEGKVRVRALRARNSLRGVLKRFL